MKSVSWYKLEADELGAQDQQMHLETERRLDQAAHGRAVKRELEKLRKQERDSSISRGLFP